MQTPLLFKGAGFSAPLFKISGYLFLLAMTLTACKQGAVQLDSKAASILNFVETNDRPFEYQFSDGETQQAIEKQWNMIEPQQQNWKYYEVFNQFKTPEGARHTSVLEMRFNPQDTSRRFSILEYEIRTYQDSSWYVPSEELEGRVVKTLSVSFAGTSYDCIAMYGYAHRKDPQPGHLRYWSPQLGTVLVWYGEQRFFEMIQTVNKQDMPLLEALKAAAKADIEP